MGIYAKTFAIPKLIEYPIGKQEGKENVSSPIHHKAGLSVSLCTWPSMSLLLNWTLLDQDERILL